MEEEAGLERAKYTGEPISVNLKDVDLKDFFRLIHEISGLNVVLDPNVHGNLTIVLDDVPWDQALDIVLKNNDLARQLEGNVLRIATVDTLKHEAEAAALRSKPKRWPSTKSAVTRFLSYANAKDVTAAGQEIPEQRGDVVADERTNAVIVNDIPAVISADRPHAPRSWTARRRKSKSKPASLPPPAASLATSACSLVFGWGNGHSAIGGVGAVGHSPTTGRQRL
jgi:type IV pilus assembly protein PilQ